MKNYIWAVNSGVCFSESLEGDLGACTLVANASSLIHLHLAVVLKWNQCGQTHLRVYIKQLTSTWSVCLISIPPHLQVVVEGGGWRCPCAHLSRWERSLVKGIKNLASSMWNSYSFLLSVILESLQCIPEFYQDETSKHTPMSLLVICTKNEQSLRHLKIGDVSHCTERSHGRHTNQPLPSAF